MDSEVASNGQFFNTVAYVGRVCTRGVESRRERDDILSQLKRFAYCVGCQQQLADAEPILWGENSSWKICGFLHPKCCTIEGVTGVIKVSFDLAEIRAYLPSRTLPGAVVQSFTPALDMCEVKRRHPRKKKGKGQRRRRIHLPLLIRKR